MAGTAQLLRSRHTRRAASADRYALTALAARRLWQHPSFLEGAVDDRVLDLFDRDGIAFTDLEHARRLARCRTQPPGELGEVVRRVQLRDRLAPAIAIDEVVPVRDQVAQRAAVVAEGHAAVHAAGALRAQLCHRARQQELAVIERALSHIPLRDVVALYLQEPPELSHQLPASPTTSSGRVFSRAPLSVAAAASASLSASSRSTRL